ncbi:hypothetical protein DYB28_008509, partial [Aphanomyces astaci]
MVEAACLYLWDISIDGLDESEFRERICKIIGEPANKWTVTKAEIKEQCKKLRVDPFGDVASRVVSFMERVNNIIDTRGWKSQLKAPNMLKTFIKVASHHSTVQLKNEQYQREAYYQNGNAPRPKGGYTQVERGRDGSPRAQGATGRPSTNKYGAPAATRRPLEDSKQPAKRAKYGPGQDDRGALALSANNRDTAELKAKRAVKAMIAEDGREQRWIRLNGVFEVPYCPDTGADQNVLPQRILEEMMTLQPDLMMVTLKEPIIGMACNNLPFQASAYVDLDIQLQTAAGP